MLSKPVVLHHGEVDRQDLREGTARDEAVRLDLARPENVFHLGEGVDEGPDVAGDVDADRAIQVLEPHLDELLGLFENAGNTFWFLQLLSHCVILWSMLPIF